MLNSEPYQIGAFLPGDCGELLPNASHLFRGAGVDDSGSDPGLSPRVSLSSLPEWRGGGLLRRLGGEKQFAIPDIGPAPHSHWEKTEA